MFTPSLTTQPRHAQPTRPRRGIALVFVLIFVIAWLTARWMGASSRRLQFRVGAYWVILTLIFELSLGRALGMSWSHIFADYNPLRGGYMLFGLAFMFLTPWITRKLR